MTIKNKHFILLFIIVMLLNGLLVFATDYLLQKEKIYHPFSHIIKNYVTINKEDGSKDYIRESVPFVKITNNKYIVQDGSHYYNIKQHFYKGNDEKINFSRAFFPLFPIVWYLTHFSPIQITIFNYLVFILGLIIIVKLFQDKVPRWSFFLVLVYAYDGYLPFTYDRSNILSYSVNRYIWDNKE
jgi:hypothetical protein